MNMVVKLKRSKIVKTFLNHHDGNIPLYASYLLELFIQIFLGNQNGSRENISLA